MSLRLFAKQVPTFELRKTESSALSHLFQAFLPLLPESQAGATWLEAFHRIESLPDEDQAIALYCQAEQLAGVKSLNRLQLIEGVNPSEFSLYFSAVFSQDASQLFEVFIYRLARECIHRGVAPETIVSSIRKVKPTFLLPWIQGQAPASHTLEECRQVFTRLSQRCKPVFDESLHATVGWIQSAFPADIVQLLFSNVTSLHPLLAERYRSIIDTQSKGEVTELAKAKKDLEAKFAEVQQQNKMLQDTKMAMLNLVDDAHRLEMQLTAERDRAQTLISSMGEGLLMVDTRLAITVINREAQRLLEVTAEEAVGKLWSEVVSTIKGNVQVPDSERSLKQCVENQQVFVTKLEDDHYYKTRSGRIFPITSVTTPIISEGKTIGAVKVFRDASHDKEEKARIEKIVEERTRELNAKNVALMEAQKEISQGWMRLRDEQAQLSASINALPLGFFIVDIKHNILNSNRKVKEILGYPDSELQFDQITALFQGIIQFSDVCNHCRKDTQPYTNTDIEYKGKFLKIYSVPVLSGETLIASAVLIEDITEAKIQERSKDEFFSIASHELRTPLTAIRGNTSMIKDYFMNELKDDNIKEMISDIHESSVRLISIVNDFLDISRVEQKKMNFAKEEIDMVALAHEVVDEVKSAGNPQVELVVDSATIPAALADKNRTKEVLINLVGNALKFTEKGKIQISFKAENGMIQTFVTDTGRGIPAQNQALLFRKFQQAGESLLTRDTTKGTGLGLYIAKIMVEGMQGTIGLVSSQQGVGSTFMFALPIAPQKNP